MKKSSLTMLLAVPLLLVGCGKKGGDKEPKAPFAVPVVDVEHLEINLPTMPTFDTSAACKKDGDYDVIDLYEMSDMHAMIDFNDSKGYYGFSGLANFMKEKRQANPGTILISSGDMWQGGSESNLTRGKVVAECMRYVGFESMALGNHEFDWGEEVIEHNSGYFTADMPLLAGNLVDKRTNARPTFLKPSRVIERGGYKIGVVGTIGDIEYSIAKSAFANFQLTSSSEFAISESARLRNEEHCDIVVWSSHEEATDSMVIPAAVDVIFGGHTHEDVNKSAMNATLGHSVPILETQNYGQSIAHAQLKINPSTKTVVEATGENIRAENNKSYLVDEANVKGLIDQYKAATAVVKQYELNKVSGKFGAEIELANLSCKAMFDMYNDGTFFCALQNGAGGVRSDIDEGMVTYGDIYTAFPFDNEIVTFEVAGNKLRDFFEKSGVRGCNKYVAETSFSKVDKTKTYKIVTTDFVCTNKLNMAEGSFAPLAGTVIRDAVAEYIYNTSGLKATNFGKDKANYQAPTNA